MAVTSGPLRPSLRMGIWEDMMVVGVTGCMWLWSDGWSMDYDMDTQWHWPWGVRFMSENTGPASYISAAENGEMGWMDGC